VYALEKKIEPLTAFVDNPKKFFYYSDTVAEELCIWHKSRQQDKLSPVTIHPKFQFVGSSDLLYEIKESAYEELVAHLQAQTPSDKNYNWKKFKRDLFIVFESGFVCYDIIPLGKTPTLLTNNLRFYRRFIANASNHQQLEQVIEVKGLEHLIDVISLQELGSQLNINFNPLKKEIGTPNTEL